MMSRRRALSPAAALLLLVVLLCAGGDAVTARKLTQGNGVGLGQGNGNGNGNGNGQGPPAEQPDVGLPLIPDQFDDMYEIIEDELLVRFKPGVTEQQKGKALAKGQAKEKRKVKEGDAESGDLSLVLVESSPGQSGRAHLRAAAAQIKNDEDVEYAEPNYVYRHTQIPNDPSFKDGVLWGMLAGTAGANAVGAWSKGYWNCSDVVIGVIDEGIQVTHPDLAANMWTNPKEVAGDGIDNDGNGRIDDINGWNFVSNNPSVYGGLSDDHGTHVAGTIGAVGNNGQGVVGVCQSGLQMISAKFLGTNGGTTANAVASLSYLLDLRNRHNLNMVATSNSWGGGGYSQSLFSAIRDHRNAGILFIAAAGNSGLNTDTSVSYPQGYNLDNVISVGAMDSNGNIASFSNFGANSVDLFAPGVAIASTIPFNSYASYSGTSMATPMVSGAVALFAAAYKQFWGVNPTAAFIKAAVMDGDADTRYTGKCVSGTRLNIDKLLDKVTITPPPPPEKLMYVQFSVTNNTISSTRSTVTVSLTVLDSVTNTPISGASLTGQFVLSPDNNCNDVNGVFPTTPTIPVTTAAGTAAVTSPQFQTRTEATNCLKRNQRKNFIGTQVTFSVTGLQADGYKADPTATYSASAAGL